jgi:hypothetical protein
MGGIVASLAGVALALMPARAIAHCDGVDGPVVSAARQALENNDVTSVMIWVQRKDEPEIRRAFEQTVAVRKLGAPARELADTYFYETLVRVHRAGEGAPYTGLKPAGRDLGPAIPAADRALETGDVKPLAKLMAEATEKGLHQRFVEARTARSHAAGNVEAGREAIGKYVLFIHYVERLHQAASTTPSGHAADAAAGAGHPE